MRRFRDVLDVERTAGGLLPEDSERAQLPGERLLSLGYVTLRRCPYGPGWGACKQQLRNVDVLRRVDGRWIPQSVTTATCCDCRVKAGTEIHALVLGDRRKTE